ncbi:DNA polymerase subunit Cdc27, partial [Chytridium lagenaria]
MTRMQTVASDMRESASDMLEYLVKTEKDVMTVKALSRKLKINIKEAQRELQDFATKHKGTVHITYLVMGEPIKTDSALNDISETVVKIVQEEDLEPFTSTLRNASSGIYSVEPSRLTNFTDLENMSWAVYQKDTMEDMKACRMIRNSSIALRKDIALAASTQVPGSQIKPISQAASISALKPHSSKDSKVLEQKKFGETSKETKPTEPKTSAATSPSTSSTNVFAKAKQARKSSFFENQIKKDTEKKVKDQEDKIQKEEEKARRLEKIRSEAVASALKNRDVHESLEKLFDDDDEDSSTPMEDAQDNEKSPPEDEVVDLTDGMDPNQYIEVKDNNDIEKVIKRVRKRRKVIKSVSRLVGKSLRTVDVEDWESYSEDEEVVVRKTPLAPIGPPADNTLQKNRAENPAKSLPITPADPLEKKTKTSKSRAPAQGQKTLMSFFGKK